MTLRFTAPSRAVTAWGIDLGTTNSTLCRGAMQQRIDKLLFVGVSRAIKWVFMSGTNGLLVQPLVTLAQQEHQAFLKMQLAVDAGGLFGTEAQPPLAPSAADDFGLD